MSDEGFLSRWSRRKLASKAAPDGPTADAVPAQADNPAPLAAEPVSEPAPAEPLPPVESLTPESDFAPFMRREIDPATRQQALKTLFADPRFNVMDGLDVYIDDYSKPDPLPEGWLAQMTQMARLGEYRPPEDVDAEKPAEATPQAVGDGAETTPPPPVSTPSTDGPDPSVPGPETPR